MLFILWATALPQVPKERSARELLKTAALGQSDALKFLFSMGSDGLSQYLEALNDRDQIVSDNAQFMIQLIADPRGLEQLDAWRKAQPVQRFVMGPIKAPLNAQDYGRLDDMLLQRPYERWTETEAINFALALAIDSSPTAHVKLRKLLERVPRSARGSDIFEVLKSVQGTGLNSPVCGGIDLEKSVLAHSKFISKGEKRETSVNLVAEDAKGNRILLREFQPFGPSFLIVLDRTPSKCLEFQSVFFDGSS